MDREHRERALHRDEAAHAAVAGLELHARDAVGGRARTGAAVALEVHAEEPELADLGGELRGDRRLLEPVADVRVHALLDERAHRVADQALLVVEEMVEVEEVLRPDCLFGLLRRHGSSDLGVIDERLVACSA